MVASRRLFGLPAGGRLVSYVRPVAVDFLPVLKGGDSGIQAEARMPRFRGQTVARGPRVAAPRLAWSIARRA